jgi:CubicO group peptidase (beta-lactamase class C family)
LYVHVIFRIGKRSPDLTMRVSKSASHRAAALASLRRTAIVRVPETIAVKRKPAIILVLSVAILTPLALVGARAQDAPHIATGFVSHVLCSAVFVSGLEPDRVFADTLDAMPGVGLIGWALAYRVDRNRGQVTTTLLGLGESRAVYRKGAGCHIDNGDGTTGEEPLPAVALASSLQPDIVEATVVKPVSPALVRALDRAFAEPEQPPFRHTKAIVVVKDGRIVAERYAQGYHLDTPLLGWSATKSVVSALTGILVRKNKIAIDRPAPIASWQYPGDAHHSITIDHLLRHTSGLAMGSSLNASLASTLAPVNRMKFIERDMAFYAARASLDNTPGVTWNYHDGNTVLLSRIIGDVVGGRAADVRDFAYRELFDPLGMRNVTLEFDAAGTLEGSSQMLAPARAWARFGQLYLDDGMIGGKRVLPAGWVDYSKSPTPNAWVGYGAGFWINLDDSFGANYRSSLGWPRDSFYASGTFGQYVIVLPTQRLVIVRFGVSRDRGDIEGVSRLVTDVIAATSSGK